MSKTPKTPRTAAFKKKVALEALREDQTLNQLASQYGIHLEGKRGRKQDENTNREKLEKKVGQLTMENDFLKKKLGY